MLSEGGTSPRSGCKMNPLHTTSALLLWPALDILAWPGLHILFHH